MSFCIWMRFYNLHIFHMDIQIYFFKDKIFRPGLCRSLSDINYKSLETAINDKNIVTSCHYSDFDRICASIGFQKLVVTYRPGWDLGHYVASLFTSFESEFPMLRLLSSQIFSLPFLRVPSRRIGLCKYLRDRKRLLCLTFSHHSHPSANLVFIVQ